LADQAGLAVFGIGEHRKKEFLDSATSVTGRCPDIYASQCGNSTYRCRHGAGLQKLLPNTQIIQQKAKGYWLFHFLR
jgi:hypothetical protein